MKKVYLAAPFFSDKQIERVEMMEKVLRSEGFDVFSPRENQLKGLEFGSKEWRDAVFANDITNIHKADLVVAIYDEEDAGTMFELGFAYANRIPCIVFNESEKVMNLMITDSLHAYLGSRNELVAYDFDKMPRSRYEGEMI
jgi:nucleoside 2-deoxyribosyltransferase